MRVAIIGANGFLGSNLTHFLSQKEMQVYPIINQNKDNLDQNIVSYTLDQLFDDLVGKLDAIILAAGSFKDSKDQLIKLHYNLTLKIKKNFPDIRFIYISSTNIYGKHNKEIKMNSNYNIMSDYGHAKLGGELIASSFKSFSIIRFTYLYGPNLSNGSFLPYIINQAIQNKEIKLYGDGNRLQDYLFIDDALELCYLCLINNDNSVILGVSGEKITNNDVAHILLKELKECKLEYVDKEETGINFSFKIEKNNLGWKPKIFFKEGLKQWLNSELNLSKK